MTITQLKDSIERFLRARDIAGIDNVEIAVKGRSVVLSGVINNRDSKRRCLDCCRHVAGVVRVEDRLELDDVVGGATSPRRC